MKLTLRRQPSTQKSTPGSLSINGLFECSTLEDVVRTEKIAGQTAIPAGTYHVSITMSNRFKRLLPLLKDVPGFEGIRMHPGNTDADTEGCILVGDDPKPDFLGKSRQAFDRMFHKLLSAYQVGQIITITIVDAE